MKGFRSPENHEPDQGVIKLLQELGSLEREYPPELLASRRSAFLAQIDQLSTVEVEPELAPGDQEVVRLLGGLRSIAPEYPPELLAARRSAFLEQIESAKNISRLDRLRVSIARIFQSGITVPSVPLPDLSRTAFVLTSLIVVAVLATLLFSHTPQSSSPSPGVAEPTRVLPTHTSEAENVLCKPGDQTPPCSSGNLDAGQDLADQTNGLARPAVSKDAMSTNSWVHQAAYVNDGRSGASWVSKSAYSWIKIDLGKVTTVNSVSLQKGSPGASGNSNPGQFEIAVALSDVYRDGNSINDEAEYTQVFNSEQTGFSGMISNAETIRTLFAPVKARFVKITFEKAGAAIDEVGVFMVQPAKRPTGTSQDDLPALTATLLPTTTLSLMDTGTPSPTGTWLPTATPTRLPTDKALATDTAYPSETPTPLPTNTFPLPDTATPMPTNPLPTDVPPTAVPPTVQAPVDSTAPIIVTSHDQTLTFTCNGNDVEVRGHANTVILLGSCSSITVTGNRNQVFWQFGSPIITNRGNDNLISQL